MFKFLYCLLVVTIQCGDISGQPEDAQQINQHFYNNVHKMISSKYDNKAESEVMFSRLMSFGRMVEISLFKAFAKSRGKFSETTTSQRSDRLAEY